ncbi:hypothetical protein ACOME3_004868 [Neoechinorhynchus agilis]
MNSTENPLVSVNIPSGSVRSRSSVKSNTTKEPSSHFASSDGYYSPQNLQTLEPIRESTSGYHESEKSTTDAITVSINRLVDDLKGDVEGRVSSNSHEIRYGSNLVSITKCCRGSSVLSKYEDKLESSGTGIDNVYDLNNVKRAGCVRIGCKCKCRLKNLQ